MSRILPSLYMVELSVSDWSAALSWYATVLDVEPVLRDDTNCFALFQTGSGRLALKAGLPPAANVLLVLEVADLAVELVRLAGRNIVAENGVKASGEGYRRAMLADPDGNRVCLFQWHSSETPADSSGPLQSANRQFRAGSACSDRKEGL